MKKKITFEEAMKQLEQTVEKLSNADLPLEDMMKLYDEGKTLSKFCGEQLDKFDAKLNGIEIISVSDEKEDEDEK